MTDKDLERGRDEKLVADGSRFYHICAECGKFWDEESHGECFDWQAIELYEAWQRMYQEECLRITTTLFII